MYNDDELKSGDALNGGAPSSESSEKAPASPESAQPGNVRPQAPSETGPRPNTTPYYEPWQQPVYRETKAPGPEPYTPGIHNGAYNAYQRYQPAPPPPPKEKKKRHFSGFAKAACLVLVCLVVSGATSFGVIQYSLNHYKGLNQNVLGDDGNNGSTPSPSSPALGDPSSAPSPGSPNVSAASTGTDMSAEDIYAMAVNQVVGVNSEEKTNVFGAASNSAVSGSGFIISADGYIVTNYHVIQYAAEQGFTLTVMMHDGKSFPAKIIGTEPDNDLAVIKIDATGLNAVTLGSNDSMKVGDKVYAVGNPLGELDYTMTNGIVSALDRVIQVEDTTSINMFQIDAAVNPGNSGGPVYNSTGEVIGIVSAKYSSSGIEGLGFAIPINDAKDIIQQLMTTGHVSGKPSMGISVQTVTPQAADYYKMVVGAYVVSVQQGSCADKAGLKIGDIITKLGDTDVTDSDSLKLAKKNFKAGDTTTIVVNRDGQELTLNITFDEEGVTATASQGSLPPAAPGKTNS